MNRFSFGRSWGRSQAITQKHINIYIYKYLKFNSGFNNEIHDLKMCASDSEPLNLFGCKWSESKNEFEIFEIFNQK